MNYFKSISALCLLVIFAFIGTVRSGEYIREQGKNSLIYDPNPTHGEVAYWSGGVDGKGYATGFGVLTWYENGVKVSAYQGKKVRGKWKTIQKLDISSVPSPSTRNNAPGSSHEAQVRGPRPGTVERSARPIPTFLARRYPFVDSESAIETTLDSDRNITEWGFQDLIAPAGTSVVKLKLFRSQAVMENQQRLYGGNFYMDGDVQRESRTRKALEADAAQGGSPMIIATVYLNPNGYRIESLPTTIEYYGGYRSGSVTGSASPFRLSDEVLGAVRRGSAYALDPYDPRSVFSYSGMVSDAGFDGIGYFTPLFLTHGESGWTRGKGYFGRFRSGELVETLSLDSFGGPLAIAAQRDAEARGAVIEELACVTLLGGMAAIAGGALKVGNQMWEAAKQSSASTSVTSGTVARRPAPTSGNGTRKFEARFEVIRDERSNQTGNEAGARGESSISIRGEQGTFEVEYWYDWPSSYLITAERGKSLVGKFVTVYFEDDNAVAVSCGAGNGWCEIKSFSRE